MGVLPRARPLWRSTRSATAAGLDDPIADARRPRAQLGQRLPRPPAVVERRRSGSSTSSTSASSRSRSCCSSRSSDCVTLIIHALMRSSSGRAILAVRSSEVAAEASGIARQPGQGHDLRPVGRASPASAACCSACSRFAGDRTPPRHRWSACSGSRSRSPSASGGPAARCSPGSRSPPAPRCSTGSRPTSSRAATSTRSSRRCTSSRSSRASGRSKLAQEPDGILVAAPGSASSNTAEPGRGRRQGAHRRRPRPPSTAVSSPSTSVRHSIETGRRATGRPRVDTDRRDVASLQRDRRRLRRRRGAPRRRPAAGAAARSSRCSAPTAPGKSTLCGVAAGLVDAHASGPCVLPATTSPTAPTFRRANDGVLLVPEARGIFPGLTVEENLTGAASATTDLRDAAYERFPILAERREAAGRAALRRRAADAQPRPVLADPPVVLIADEPTLGLAPLAAEEVDRGRSSSCAIAAAPSCSSRSTPRTRLAVADTLAFMELGNIVWSGPRARRRHGPAGERVPRQRALTRHRGTQLVSDQLFANFGRIG